MGGKADDGDDDRIAGLDPLVRELKNFRIINRLKQSALADLLGVDQTTVSRWERGISVPELAMRQKIGNMIARGALDDRYVLYLFDHAPVPTALIDRNLRCLALSPAAVELHRVERSDVIGRVLADRLNDSVALAFDTAVKAGFFSGEVASLVPFTQSLHHADVFLKEFWFPVLLSDNVRALGATAVAVSKSAFEQAHREGCGVVVTRFEDLIRG